MKALKIAASLVTSAVLALAGGSAMAQTNIEKLKQMKVATTDLNIPLVPQTGKNADAIRENLKRVKLPPGFKIDAVRRSSPTRATWRWRRAPTCCSSARARPPSGP